MNADQMNWEHEFVETRHRYHALAQETEFALEKGLEAAGVRIHLLEPRTKTLSSLREKVQRKGYDDPLAQVEDLAGVRVVVLFRSDLGRVRDVVHSAFDILTEEDTIDGGDESNFGYMSVHYVARLKQHHAGPRYDELQGLKVEIQARTIITDAWATLSRYLDYKGESSIPSALRRDFLALSGLFYVADQHFELFSLEAARSAEAVAQQENEQLLAQGEINLDTLKTYLERRYPDRDHVDSEGVSELVEQLARYGYSDLAELDRALTRSATAFRRYEADHPPEFDAETGEPLGPGVKYADVGVVRSSLAIVDQNWTAGYTRSQERFQHYRDLLDPPEAGSAESPAQE